MIRSTICLFLIFFTVNLFAQTVHTVESIPNPKTSYGGLVSNPDNVLSASAVSTINQLLLALEDSTTAQVAVAVVNSIGDKVPGDFRTQLFRYWGIGQQENNNGLLILLVMDQRRMEFEVGYGLEGILTDAVCKRIQEEYMVPLAKEGRFDECVLAGVNEVIKILSDPIYREDVLAESLNEYGYKPWWRENASIVGLFIFGALYLLGAIGGFAGQKKRLKSAPAYVKNNADENYLKTKFLALNIGVPGAFLAWQEIAGSVRIFEAAIFIYGFIMVLLVEKRFRVNKYIFKETANKLPQETYNLLAKSHSKGWLASTILFPLPFIFYSLFNRNRMKELRNTPPLSADGTANLNKLNEIADDGFLEAFQLTEEKLRSVDYDVWKHPITNEIKIFRYENYFSKYSACPKCTAKAYLMTKNETLSSPTYESTGTGQKTYVCSSCSYTTKSTYTIPKRTRSSSSGSGSSGGGGGGSFGGGSSGGGGGGSSW